MLLTLKNHGTRKTSLLHNRRTVNSYPVAFDASSLPDLEITKRNSSTSETKWSNQSGHYSNLYTHRNAYQSHILLNISFKIEQLMYQQTHFLQFGNCYTRRYVIKQWASKKHWTQKFKKPELFGVFKLLWCKHMATLVSKPIISSDGSNVKIALNSTSTKVDTWCEVVNSGLEIFNRRNCNQNVLELQK